MQIEWNCDTTSSDEIQIAYLLHPFTKVRLFWKVDLPVFFGQVEWKIKFGHILLCEKK